MTPQQGAEDQRREKRAKRFEAQNGSAGASKAASYGSGGRLVQGGVHSYGAYSGISTPDSEAVYDPVSLPMVSRCLSNRLTC